MDEAQNFKGRYVKNAVIFREGEDPHGCMFEVVDGLVGIFSAYEQPHQKLLTTLGPGSTFGEMGVIEGQVRSATAVALRETYLNIVTSETLEEYFLQRPERILEIMRHMSARIRTLSDDYRDACDAIAEYLAAERAGAEKPPSLMERMRLFASRRNKG